MQKDYIGNKPKTHCDNVAKYIQMDTVIFRKEWYGWGNPTAYSSYRLNVKDFTNKESLGSVLIRLNTIGGQSIVIILLINLDVSNVV